jgi:CRISPR-associated protein Csd1
VLPVTQEEKAGASRATFWKQIKQAADETGNASLRAAAAFGELLERDDATREKVATSVDPKDLGKGNRCTLECHEDEGRKIVELADAKDWFRRYFAQVQEQRKEEGPEGLCQVTGQYGPIATTHSMKLSGLPGGLAMGTAVVSNDKPAFQSYGLEDAANASIGYRAAEGYARAMQALIDNEPAPGNVARRTRLTVGETTFLFWTRQGAEFDVASLLDAPSPSAVAKLLESPGTGRAVAGLDADEFYCLAVSANAARVVVRDYLEEPVGEAKRNLASWFEDLRIIDQFSGESTSLFPLWRLSAATAREPKEVAPHVPVRLLMAVLKKLPLPESVLAECLGRLRAEGSGGFRAERMGLIRLCMNRWSILQGDKEGFMGECMETERNDAAYVCGRLLAVFERLQWGALRDVNATVIDRFYGTASTAPATVFPRLFKSAQQHLSKLEAEKPGMAENLRKQLEDLSSRIQSFPLQLSLRDQGRFALGFYHQRADYRRASQERKAAAAAAAE